MTAGVAQKVHYVAQDGDGPPQCLAAIVTLVPIAPETDDDASAVSLAVFTPRGHFFVDDIRMDEGEETTAPYPRVCSGLDHEPGTWHLPAED